MKATEESNKLKNEAKRAKNNFTSYLAIAGLWACSTALMTSGYLGGSKFLLLPAACDVVVTSLYVMTAYNSYHEYVTADARSKQGFK